MDDELRLNRIVPPKRRETPLNQKRKKDKQEHEHKEEAGDHFQDLAKAAELAHDTLDWAACILALCGNRRRRRPWPHPCTC